MASQTREKFTTQVNTEILSTLRGLAQAEGCQFQALIDEALDLLIEKSTQCKLHAIVMAAYQVIHEKLYKKLAEVEPLSAFLQYMETRDVRFAGMMPHE